MPLPKAKTKGKTGAAKKKAVNTQVSKNISELVHHGSRPRSMKQIIAIAEATARGRKGKKKR